MCGRVGLPGAVGGLYLDLALAHKPASALDVGHLVFLEQVSHTFDQLLGYGSAALLCRTQVGLDPVEDDAMGSRRFQLVHEGGAGEEGLGGHTADVQAHTPELVLLHARRAQPQLSRPYGRHVAAGAPTDDENVEVLL